LPRRHALATLLGLLLLGNAGGCGQKGPLTLSDGANGRAAPASAASAPPSR
jgi:predicted small lipoprotein YifL